MVHDDYKEMLPARALSALDAGDNRTLNEHLLVCSECRREFENWESISSSLALNALPIEPSAELRDRIMSQVRAERKSQTAEAPASRVVPLAAPKKNVTSPAWSDGLIAAGIIFSILVGWIALLSRENRSARNELARLTEQVKTTEQQLAQERQIVALLTAPGSRFMELTATSSSPGSRGMLAYNSNGQAMLLTNGLPSAPAGKGYQLWFIVGSQPLPGKVFNTDQSGSGTLRDDLPRDLDDKTVFAITMENAEGAKTPTGPILLRSDL
jgi:anti-sigma-K factor RskA